MTKSEQQTQTNRLNSSYRTKQMVILALIAAIAYAVTFVCRLPIIPSIGFVDLEFKSAVILIGGFIFGPMSGFIMTVVVCLLEMITFSSTGIIGCIMNILATACIVVPASFVYKKKSSPLGATVGLAAGVLLMTVAMVLWNYLVTPIYMGVPREAVEALLLPAFVPFNLLKGALNGAAAMLLYKFVLAALEKSNLIPKERNQEKNSISSIIGVVIVSLLVLLTCVLIILAFNGVF